MNQNLLEYTIDQAPKDLDSLTKQYDQISASIAEQTDMQTLYQSMMDKSKTDLEARLTTIKVPAKVNVWQSSFGYVTGDIVQPTVVNGFVYICTVAGTSDGSQPVWPLIVGNTVIDSGVTWECHNYVDAIYYGPTYGVSTLSDWVIMGNNTPPPTSVYSYAKTATLWSATGGQTENNEYLTIRNIVSPSILATSIRIKIKGSTFGTGVSPTILRVYIGQRIPATQNVVPGTSKSVTFNGGQISVTLNSGESAYSDWIPFTLTPPTEYFVSVVVDSTGGSYFHRWNPAGFPSFIWVGDHGATETWGVSGTAYSYIGSVELVEGFDAAGGTAWDGDSQITQNVNDWGIIYPLIYSSPFGTTALITSLNSAKNLIGTRKNQIAARNPILVHFKTYTITALADTGCTITPGTVDVDYGKSQQFMFTGGTYIMVDGIRINSVVPHTFTNVTEPHTIKVFA